MSYPLILLYLSCYRPHLRGLDNLCAQQEAVVLVVVGNDDAALLLAGQHELHIVLDVGTRLVERRVDVLHREVDDGEAMLQLANDTRISSFVLCF